MPKDSPEYSLAKLIMNKTIGCWHRKDRDQKDIMTYDDKGSYQLAHIVAVAIARGNQKILNKIDEIGLIRVAHICVDGIIYLGDDDKSDVEKGLGKFGIEFIGKQFKMTGINVYCAMDKDQCVKFRHGGYDLLYNKEIDENSNFTFDDLYHLGCKERIGDIING